MRTTELDRETKKATEPAKRWRNRYWSDRPVKFSNYSVEAGEWCSRREYPSKDVAETSAADYLKMWGSPPAPIYNFIKYLGAFPVSE